MNKPMDYYQGYNEQLIESTHEKVLARYSLGKPILRVQLD